MEVKRIDLFDFKVTLTEDELEMIKAVCIEYNNELEDRLLWIIEQGLKDCYMSLE